MHSHGTTFQSNRKRVVHWGLAGVVILWLVLLAAPQASATPVHGVLADAQALIIYDGSPVVTASADRPLTVRMRASAPVSLVTYALYRVSRATFQRLAVSYGPVTVPDKAMSAWVDQPSTTAFSTRLDRARLPAAGLYLLTVTAAEGASSRVLLVITHTVLTLKRSPRQVFVWTTGLATGQPVAGAKISVFTQPEVSQCDPSSGCASTGQTARERLVASGTTDRTGIFAASLPAWLDPYAELIAVANSSGDQSLASTAWTARLQTAFSSGNAGAYYPSYYAYATPGAWRAYLYSDRPIYRPGQTVHLRGIVRADDDGLYHLPSAGSVVTLTLSDPNGQPVFSGRRRLDRFGTLNLDIALDAMATIGQYTLQATAGSLLNASLPLTVAAYRKPEYAVSITPSEGQVTADGGRSYVQGAALPLTAQARYYFGAPLAGARVRWAVVSSDYWFSPPAYGDYSFDENSGWWWGGFLPPRPLLAADAASIAAPGDQFGYPTTSGGGIRLQGQGKTNDQGVFFWQVPSALHAGERSQTFTIEATAIDASGQEVAQRTAAVIHRALFYVGLRQARDKGQGFAGQPGQPQHVDVLALGLDGKTLQQGQPVVISAVRRRWIDRWVRDTSGNGQYQESYQDVPVATHTVTTGADGRALFTFVPATAGDYRLTATARDVLGHPTRSALDIWVSTYGESDADWGTRTDDGLRVIPDRASYAPGDVANLLVNAPAAGMLALVTLERGSVLEHHLVALKGSGDVIAVRLGARSLPNVFVGVTVVRGDGGGKPPLWRQGYVQLHVADDSVKLAVSIRADRATYRPRQKATLTVTARDATGRPAQAALSLAVVDQAVLALTAANTAGSLPAFYFDRPLDVTTAGTLVQLADRLPLGQPFWGCRFCHTTAPAGVAAQSAARAAPLPKAGGAGPGGRAAPVPRTYFPDTALWLPSLVTNNQGVATVQVQLPDNLTTWALAGTAADMATRVGDGTGSLVVAKDLLVRPELPRFLRAGDHVTLRAVLNNTTNRALRTVVTLKSQGVALSPGVQSRRVVTVPANGELPLGWPVLVGRPGQDARVVISAIPDDPAIESDAVALALAVEPASFSDVLAGAGATAGEGRQVLRLPSDVDSRQSSLQLTLTPSLAAGLGPALDYLRSYPYWCAEQTTSHLFPEMVLRHVAPGLPAVKRADTGDLHYALRLLQSLQQPDGGWGWWYETGSSPFMTAYAMDGLLAARRAGFSVPDGVLSRGIEGLRQWVSGDQQSAEFANVNVQAYAGYILSMAGATWDGRSLYSGRANIRPHGLAYLALALRRQGAPAQQVATVLHLIRAKAQRDSEGRVWWPQADYDDRVLESPVRSTAVALDALARLSPGDPLTPGGVRWLVEQRQDSQWQDTQDTAISLVALGDYLAHSGELRQSYRYTVMLGSRALAAGRVTPAVVATGITVTIPISGLLQPGPITLRILRQPAAPSGSWLYYGYTLRYTRRTVFVAPQEHGVAISRRYIVLRGGRWVPEDKGHVARAHPGDILRVELTISTAQTLNYVMVEDPLPSGAEPLDASLLTSSLATQLRNQGDLPTQQSLPSDARDASGSPLWWWTWYPDHVELRDDRAALFVTYLDPGVYHYSYLAQITAAGHYRALPAHIEAMYRPQINGHSAGQQLVVQ